MKAGWIGIAIALLALASGAIWWSSKRAASVEVGPAPGSTPVAAAAPPGTDVAAGVETVEDLIAQLAWAETRGYAQLRLQDMGDEAHPALAAALPAAAPPTRDLIVALLASAKNPTYLPPILMLFERPDEDSQLTALRGVGKFEAIEEKERILRIARDPAATPSVREVAADLLIRWAEPGIVPTLLSWLAAPEPGSAPGGTTQRDRQRLRLKAIAGLGQLRAAEAVNPLHDLLLGPERSLHADCAVALARIGGPGTDALASVLDSKDRDRTVHALRGFAQSQDPRAAALVRPLLTESDERIRKTAHDTLKRLERKSR